MHSIIMSPGLAGNYPAAGARLALLARCCLHLRLCADSKALLWEGVQGHLQQQFSTGKGLAQGLLSSLTCCKAGRYPLGLHQHSPEENLVPTPGVAGTVLGGPPRVCGSPSVE